MENKIQVYQKFMVTILLSVLLLSGILPARAEADDTSSGSGPTLNNQVYLPLIGSGVSSSAGVYYISPSGYDGNSGTNPGAPWKTFDHAWQFLYPGDTLILLDGTYYQSIAPNVREGTSDNPITIRAQNDGKVVIDGQNSRVPIELRDAASHYIIEGLIALNGDSSVIFITADHNILRRVSAYNANTDDNDQVIVIWANYTLLEDCVAAGSGRKMIVVFSSIDANGHDNVIRRCFTAWGEWDGKIWQDLWPWGDGIEIYNGDHNTIENSIVYGRNPTNGFSLLSNGPDQTGIVQGNKILGSIAINVGTDYEGNITNWGTIRPQPSNAPVSSVRDFTQYGTRVSFKIKSVASVHDNLLQDVFSWGGAGLGFSFESIFGDPGYNNQFVRGTFLNNGLDASYFEGGVGTDVLKTELDKMIVSNSKIGVIRDVGGENFPPLNDEGARLINRYIDGVLTGEPLWPWPMEQRIRDEMGLSVTNLVAALIPDQVNPIADAYQPFLSVSPITLPFGPVRIGQPVSQYIHLKNLGNAPLTVNGFQLGNANSPFSITSGGTCSTPPFTLTPSQSCSVNILFSPNDYSAHTNDLYFFSPSIGSYPSAPSVYLSGIGYSTISSISLPGKLEAEAFSESYGNFEIKPTSDDGGSGKIGGIAGGAWLDYPVDIAQTGQYRLIARVASIPNDPNVRFSVAVDGITIATLYPINTGDWNTFVDIEVTNLFLSQGQHTLRVNLLTGSFDLNYIKFELS